jgi:hypothetical protein
MKARLWFILRLGLKAGILFVVFNLLFALTNPMPILNRISLYNLVFTGRLRLPYAENPSESYNITLTDLDALFASHELSGADKKTDEYRVLLLGDSAVWGWLLEPDQTLSACLNQQNLITLSGKTVHAYNLGYPVLDVTKDLLILEKGLDYEPDLVLWFVTLAATYEDEQLFHEVVRANPERVRDLNSRYDLALKVSELPAEPDFMERSIIGQRRALADWLRHQVYGVAWTATGIDHRNPEFFEPVRENLQEGDNILNGASQADFVWDSLALEIISAGAQMTAEQGAELLLINEPIYQSSGLNSDVRYNFYYPRWAYDGYRDLMQGTSTNHGWQYVDFWDAVPSEFFTDSSLHFTPSATCDFAKLVGTEILKVAE